MTWDDAPPYSHLLGGRLLVVSGPSGVGKSTVVRKLVELRPDTWLSVSATTRPQRSGEVIGVDYTFMSGSDFAAQRDTGGFLESAEFAGNLYGTPREAVVSRLKVGQDVVLEIDLQGARQVKAAIPGAITVFLAPPSIAELHRRLASRGTEDAVALQRRTAAATAELAAAGEFDHKVVNADVVQAAHQLVRCIDS